VHETRRGDYAAYAAEAKIINNEWRDVFIKGVPVSSADDHPVVNVSWNDASSFCNWLQEKEGLAYRLPTDREWSIAVGLGRFEDFTKSPEENMRENQNLFPWGTSIPPPVGAGNYANEQTKDRLSFIIPFVGYEDGHLTTAPVMSFKANVFGLFDMGGNVWEWCEDWFNNSQKERVLRGGSWWNGEHHAVLSSRRDHYAPNIRFVDRGFRVVVSLQEKIR
jgi:formylglycine-generating enzyme required for sulfatase activity